MKKYLYTALVLGIILFTGIQVVRASFTLDYGNGLVFNFENQVTVNGHVYSIDNIEYNSDTLTNGQYYLNTIDAIYASKDTMNYYDDDIDATGNIHSKFKLATANEYDPDDLTVTDYVSPQSDLKTGPNNKIALIKSRTEKINPGEYIVDTFVQGRVVTSTKICLPTFTSTTGNSIGNVTCGNSLLTPAPNQTTTQGVTVIVNNPVVTPETADVNGKYKVTVSGTISATTAMQVGISLFYGTDMYSLSGPTQVFAPQNLNANESKTFEYTLTGLTAGTQYFYKFVKSGQNTDLTGRYDFRTTGVNQGTPIIPYDPNADTGAILDYSFPTNLGEPTGEIPTPTVAASILVPCGRSDQQQPDADGNPNPDANCKFKHIPILVGNVIQFLLAMLIPITVLACVYTGVQMILHRSIPADLVKYKDRLIKIFVGLVIMLLAFTIVGTVMKVFLGDNASRYLLIDISNL